MKDVWEAEFPLHSVSDDVQWYKPQKDSLSVSLKLNMCLLYSWVFSKRTVKMYPQSQEWKATEIVKYFIECLIFVPSTNEPPSNIYFSKRHRIATRMYL